MLIFSCFFIDFKVIFITKHTIFYVIYVCTCISHIQYLFVCHIFTILNLLKQSEYQIFFSSRLDENDSKITAQRVPFVCISLILTPTPYSFNIKQILYRTIFMCRQFLPKRSYNLYSRCEIAKHWRESHFTLAK